MTSAQDEKLTWRDVTLSDVLTLQRGFDLPKDERHDGPFPVIASTGAVGVHKVAKVVGPGVVIGRSGSLGGGQYIKIDFWPLNTTLWVKDFKGNDRRFCYYLLKSLDLAQFNAGSGVPTLNRNHIHPLPASLPPLPEQRAIAHVLGTLDDKIELNQRMNETLEEMARALFKSWFVDFDPVRAKMEGRWRRGESLPGLPAEHYDLFPDRLVPSELGEIPEGWEVKSLGELCEKPQYGYTQSAKKEPIGPKFLRITDINKKAWIDWESVPHCEITDEDFDKYRLKEGDVLIARMADPGHGCMIDEGRSAVFASYLIRFHPTHKRYTRFIQYWLRSDHYWELVMGRGTGTTRVSLNAKVISGFPILLPANSPLDKFGDQISGLRSRIIANANESRALDAHRDALLPKLVSGQMRVAKFS